MEIIPASSPKRSNLILEIPEATTLARQIDSALKGKTVQTAIAASSPHKLAWYHGDPAEYPARLLGSVIQSARAVGGMVELTLTRATLLFSDGVNLRWLPPGEPPPTKHQLLLTYSDASALVASVQMYGGLLCWLLNEHIDNIYYQVALKKPSLLTDAFSESYFHNLLAGEAMQKLSLKTALATEQRIPGLGNGVLQDILWNARLSPRRKVGTLSVEENHTLYTSLKSTLVEMTRLGRRDTEKDLFGEPGGYLTVMSSKNNKKPCPICGTAIVKEVYLGGSVYYCPHCQKS